jgi:multidrug transporter EmrE-like cation transporter
MKIALFAGYVLFSVAGLIILKRYLPQIAPVRWADVSAASLTWIAFGALLYLASFALWLFILRNVPLSTAYPVAVGLTLCGTTLASLSLLREHIPAGKAVGILLIIGGVIFVSRNS